MQGSNLPAMSQYQAVTNARTQIDAPNARPEDFEMLATVVAAWPQLPAVVRTSIAQIVSAQVGTNGRSEAGAAREASGLRPARPAFLVYRGEQNSRKEPQT